MSDAQFKKRLRGVILRLVSQNHAAQRHRYDDYTLLSVLAKLGFDVYLNLVRELVQDLAERGALNAQQQKDQVRGGTSVTAIQITPHGRDLLEGTKTDAAILVEAE